MKRIFKFLRVTLIFATAFCLMKTTYASSCTGEGVALQVLGSGGPEVQDKRASSSYLVWQDGKARVLVDSGGGSALRFGESGATMTDLSVILLTHLHADHSADLPALIKSSYFENRTNPLLIYGPTGNRAFPDTHTFIEKLLGEQGAYRYLSDFLSADNQRYVLQPQDVALNDKQVKTIFRQSDLVVKATKVEHGIVPALAWRVEIGGKSIVFSGDMNGNNDKLQRLAKSADILVAHNAVPESATGAARYLHMPPSVIGKIAAEADVGQLVLSHRMLRTLGKEAETAEIISRHYDSTPIFANDLDCFRL